MADPGGDSFESLALEVFRRQSRRNQAYRGLLDQRGLDPARVNDWREIPAVSTAAFKFLRLCGGPSTLVFRTSGTTQGSARRGEHHLVDADLYRASLRRSFRRWVLPDDARLRFLVLTPDPAWAPDSSLGFMAADLLDLYGAAGSGFFLQPDGLVWEPLLASLERAQAEGVAVALLGTAFAFVNLLDGLAGRARSFRLPPSSRIMDTGGFKGRSRSVERRDLLRGYSEFLGVPAGMVVNEYGMTELGSQFYDGSLRGLDPAVQHGPHWVRTRVIDPETGHEAPPGRPGLLRHYDLANLDSVMVVETEDLGLARDDGFVLLGRARGAEPRGCSLDQEDLPGEPGT